jgi:hypothetical protein
MTKQEKIVEMAVEMVMTVTRLARKPIVTRRVSAIIEKFREDVAALDSDKKSKKT